MRIRETTRLLSKHVPVQLAELIESYIMPGDDVSGLKLIFELLKAGHWELSQGYFNMHYSARGGLRGAIAGNSIHLVRAMVEVSVEHLDFYIRFARDNGCDSEIIELLLSHHNIYRDCEKIQSGVYCQ